MRRLTGACLLGLLVLGLTGTIVAQSSPWDGKFVSAMDGSIWLISGGVRHQLQAAQIGDQELGQFPVGEPIADLTQLGQAVAAPPAPATVAPRLSPPATLIGLTPRICKDGVPFALEVLESDWTKTLGSGAGSSPEGGMWVLIVVNATNTGQGNENLYRSMQLADERGRVWGDVAGTAAAVLTDYANLANQRGAQPVTALLKPGVATRVLVVYNVAADVQRLELRSIVAGC